MDEGGIAAWKFPPIVAAIAVSIVGGFYLGGPGLGMAVGALAAATIIVMAVRNPPRYPIVPPPAGDDRQHVLVILGRPLEGAVVDSLTRLAGGVDAPGAEVRLIAPSRHSFLDRWASDLDAGRHRAQRTLVISSAALAAARVDATARVGDEDLVQMVEDELRTFPATEAILVGAGGRRGVFGEAARRELESRLTIPLRCIVADEPTATSASTSDGRPAIRS